MPQALDDDAFRQLLADCKLFSAGHRNGLVPFDADCIARRLARHTGHDQPRALAHLAHWAASLGGGLDDTVVWLYSEIERLFRVDGRSSYNGAAASAISTSARRSVDHDPGLGNEKALASVRRTLVLCLDNKNPA